MFLALILCFHLWPTGGSRVLQESGDVILYILLLGVLGHFCALQKSEFAHTVREVVVWMW